MKRLLALLIALLLVAACGGGDDGGATRDPGPTAADSDDEPAGDDEDQALAEDAVLKLSDFEAGWRADEPGEDDDGGFEDCEGFGELDKTAEADSKKFVRDDAEVENTVVLTPDEGQADGFMQLIREEATVECLRDGVEETIADNVKDDPAIADNFDDISVKVGPASVGQHGDDAAGFQIVVTLEGALSVDLYADFVFVRKGRALTFFSFVDVFGPFTGQRDELIEAVVDRLDSAA
jgi:hypothetical protein